ncbi:MAG: GtrA family protein [Sulfuritalea sp.]|jgi:putative flippase GtrA|nr:GtrA family protein [Sulfuritalea sp.]
MFGKKRDFSVLANIARYGVVGVLNNLLGYLIYIALTWRWLDPKIAVTLLYPIGAFTAYFGHARFSFSQAGYNPLGPLKYAIALCVGYCANILMLYMFSDILKFPHQIVQAVATVAIGGILYLMFRYFVFRPIKLVNRNPLSIK